MTSIAKPPVKHPSSRTNGLGLTLRDYEGAMSTLCAGCGHDSVTAALVLAAWEMDLEPHRAAKMSGIGCSSKTTAYFMKQSHGFNSVHGRMPSVTTGAAAANRGLTYIGISGDGDSLSIGLGQLCHAIRRNVNMLYVIENNGVYGLTKGQFSATSDKGSKAKKGAENKDSPIDLVMLALQLGATYVGRSFSGDKTQLVPLIKGALSHKGAAILDVLSPCVAFNNHVGSTKSFDYIRAHNEAVNRMDVISPRAPIRAEYAPGELKEVVQHDGSILRLRKLEDDYDPSDRNAALAYLARKAAEGEIVTGLLFVDPAARDLHDGLSTADTPLNKLTDADLIPPLSALEKINAGLR